MTASIASASHDEAGLLEVCPFCRYSLRGLAVAQKCPECGHEVDRRWRIFGGPNVSAKAVWALRLVLTAKILLLAVVVPFILSFSSPVQFPPLLYIVWAGAVLLLWTVLPTRVRAFVALTGDGVRVFRKPTAPVLHAWTTIRKAVHNPLRKAIELETGDGVVRYSTNTFFSIDFAEADRFVRAVNVAVRAQPTATATAD